MVVVGVKWNKDIKPSTWQGKALNKQKACFLIYTTKEYGCSLTLQSFLAHFYSAAFPFSVLDKANLCTSIQTKSLESVRII